MPHPVKNRSSTNHLRWLGMLQAADTFVFVRIQQLPHWKLSDRVLTHLSWMISSGIGWLVFFLLATLVDPQRGWKATRAVAPALCLTTVTAEHPIKKWFRRRRPFFPLTEATIVGRKPGGYSFPSGHSVAAFAGALLLAREYPASARGLFGLASLVAFSRIYLGVHYPGDVLSGSLLGIVLARVYSRLLRRVGVAHE
jgi:undecaprenyl-diphosphatase